MLRALEQLNEWVGKAVSWLTLVMVLVMLGIVIARYAFNIGSIATQESIIYLHAAVFMLGAGFALKHDQHVRVDIFYRQRSVRGKALIDLLGTILLLWPVCIYLIVASSDYVQAAWTIKEGSREAGGLPLVYLLKTLIPISAALLAIEGLFVIRRCVTTLRGGTAPGAGPDPGSGPGPER